MVKRKLTRREVILARRARELDAAEELLQQAQLDRLEAEQKMKTDKQKVLRELRQTKKEAAKLVADTQQTVDKLRADAKQQIEKQLADINEGIKVRNAAIADRVKELDARDAKLLLDCQKLNSAEVDYKIRAEKLVQAVKLCEDREKQLDKLETDWLNNRLPVPSDPRLISTVTFDTVVYSYYMQQDQQAKVTGFTQLADGRMGYLGVLYWGSAISNQPVPLDPDWFHPHRPHAIYCWYAECERQIGLAQALPERQRVWVARRDIAAAAWRKLQR